MTTALSAYRKPGLRPAHYRSCVLEKRSMSASHVHVRKGSADTGSGSVPHITVRLESAPSMAARASRSAGFTDS